MSPQGHSRLALARVVTASLVQMKDSQRSSGWCEGCWPARPRRCGASGSPSCRTRRAVCVGWSLATSLRKCRNSAWVCWSSRRRGPRRWPIGPRTGSSSRCACSCGSPWRAPLGSGRIGAVRSNAWIWDISVRRRTFSWRRRPLPTSFSRGGCTDAYTGGTTWTLKRSTDGAAQSP